VIARIAKDAVRRYCQSADDELNERHVVCPNGFQDPDVARNVRAVVLPWARRIWADIREPSGRHEFTHDNYLKIWALERPVLHYDFLLFDECQDAWPSVSRVISDQTHLQRVVVGDPAQAIYEWRGAQDSLDKFTGRILPLSHSWRFGPDIAAEANKWLGIMGASMRLTGSSAIDSKVGAFPGLPSMVLCRTNAGMVAEAMQALDEGHAVALHGKRAAEAIRSLAEAAISLKLGQGTHHPELFAFRTWGELQVYVEEDSGGADLRVFVELIDAHGPQKVIDVMDALVPEADAEVTYSTAHGAKGGEWDRVRIANDFREPSHAPNQSLSEFRLNYVAVTRAARHLDRGGLDWVDQWIAAEARARQRETAVRQVGVAS
jgi:hypothetical protein